MDFSRYQLVIDNAGDPPTRKRPIENAELDGALNDLVNCRAVHEGTLDDQVIAIGLMKRLLDLGANPNPISNREHIAVGHAACWREYLPADPTEIPLNIQAVHLLMAYGAVLHINYQRNGATALHGAARFGGIKMIEFLLKQNCSLCITDADGHVPLLWALASRRPYDNDNGYAVVKLLVERTLSAKGITSWTLQSTLFSAIRLSARPDHIRILLESKRCDVDGADADGETPLHKAASNRLDGPALISLLLEFGANPALKCKKGYTPFMLACVGGTVESAKALALYASDNKVLSGKRTPRFHPDYIAMYRFHLTYGSSPITRQEIMGDIFSSTGDFLWAKMRLVRHRLSPDECSAVRKAASQNIYLELRVRRLVEDEMGTDARIDNTNDTYLHIAVRDKSVRNVQFAMQCHVNPFLLNRKDECALNYPCTPEIRAMLDEYTRFNCLPHQMRWWGPYFRKRVVAFLLVMQRWHKEKVREIPRDVRVCILRWVARFEAV
jgi:ankyrin repeat protein